MFQSTPVTGRNSLEEVTPLPIAIIPPKGEVSNRSLFLMNKTAFTTTVLAATLALNGCSSMYLQPIRDEAKANKSAIDPSLEKLKRGDIVAAPKETPIVTRKSGLLISAKKSEEIISTANPAKNHPLLKKEIAFGNQTFSSISELAERITVLSGVPIAIMPDALIPAQSAAAVGAVASMSGAVPAVDALANGINGASGIANMPPLPMGIPTVSGVQQTASAQNTILNLSYKGTLQGLLDVAAARYSVDWEMRGDRLEIFRYATKTFVIKAIPGGLTNSASITSTGGSTAASSSGSPSGSGSSSGSTSGQTGLVTKADAGDLSIWKGVDDAVKTMLGPGEKHFVSPANGTLTVTATPRTLALVQQYVDRQNRHMTKEVAVSVEVLSVTLNRDDNYGINWDLVYQTLSGNYGLALKSAFSPAEGASALTGSVLSTATGSAAAYAGTKAVATALSTQGDVSLVTSATLVTLNNQPAPILVGRQTGYVASSTTTVGTSGSGNTVTNTPGSVTTGFSMNVLPHIQDDGSLLLQYALDISELIKIQSYGDGTSLIQVPEIETRNFLQRAQMQSGETLIVSGFQYASGNATSEGIGDPDFTAAGGGINGSSTKTVLVVLVRPMIIEKGSVL